MSIFPFKYVGGGYFRLKGVPVGEEAPMLHGEEAPTFVMLRTKNPNQTVGQVLESMGVKVPARMKKELNQRQCKACDKPIEEHSSSDFCPDCVPF